MNWKQKLLAVVKKFGPDLVRYFLEKKFKKD